MIFYILANDLFAESFRRASFARADGDPAAGDIILVIWGQGLPVCAALGMNQECREGLSAISGQPRALCTAGEGPWEVRYEKDCRLAYKSKDDPQVRHVAVLVIVRDKAQVCQPACKGEEVPSALVPSVSVLGSGCALHIFHFHKRIKEITSQINKSGVLRVSLY